jgi:competence protein CoiA
MLNALSNNGEVLAEQVNKANGPFSCPMCKGDVIVKKGRINIDHFAHKADSNCSYGQGESEQHRRAKQEIYKALKSHPQVSKLKLERSLGDVRPDISFYLGSIPIAIEVQVSTLSLDTIDRRTASYAGKGIYLLWVSPYDSAMEYNRRYSPHSWEKYIHAMYFGKVYYWLEYQLLQPVHFDPYRLYVEETEYGGGYFRDSKRYRTPRLLEPMMITTLSAIKRKPWNESNIPIPAARLWG